MKTLMLIHSSQVINSLEKLNGCDWSN